jgi:hypothetical protein
MKITTIVLATVLTLSSTLAFAVGGGDRRVGVVKMG